MIIGERLKMIRESKEMSQGDIEKRTGLLRCYISRVENGHTVPAVETLEKLARAMEIPLYQLFYDGQKPAEPLVLKTSHTPKLNRAALNNLRKVGTAFTKMQPKHINLVVHISQKFAER